MNDTLGTFLQFAGRLHPVILHVPIGLICGLGFIEAIVVVRRKLIPREIFAWLVWLTAGFTALAAVTGYQLHLEGENAGWVVERHLQLGFALAGATLITAILHTACHRPLFYRGMLIIAIGLMIPTGHLGGSMTHGERFLTEPFTAGRAAALMDTAEAPADMFTASIAPILQETCIGCHGESRQKGGLALHSFAAMEEGGDGGPVFIAGDLQGSEIIRRLRLPLDADGHMPPKGKPQPAEDQIAIIEQWITQGASTAPMTFAAASIEGDSAKNTAADRMLAIPAHMYQALNALDKHLVHYEALAEDEHLLSVKFAAVAGGMDDALARQLLEPVLSQLASVSLERSETGDETAAMLAGAPNLIRINLSRTKITEQALVSLSNLEYLRELVLTQTSLNDEATKHLESMRALRHVYLWGTLISNDAIAQLRTSRPDLSVDDGVLQQADALEVEPELTFTGDRPVYADAGAAAVLRPVNTVCPVTGGPINPLYTIVYKNQVIAFCCGDCAVKFWAEPEPIERALRDNRGRVPHGGSPGIPSPP